MPPGGREGATGAEMWEFTFLFLVWQIQMLGEQ